MKILMYGYGDDGIWNDLIIVNGKYYDSRDGTIDEGYSLQCKKDILLDLIKI